jgi:AcrR family transcriptional regulator
MTARERLIASAQELLWERGYVGTSPRAIQERARAGQGSMYHHFKGKAGLFLAVADYLKPHCVQARFASDPIVRRAESLQATRDAQPPRAWVNAALAQKLGLAQGAKARVRQGEGEAVVEIGIDERLPAGCVRLAAGHKLTSALGPMFGAVSVERA